MNPIVSNRNKLKWKFNLNEWTTDHKSSDYFEIQNTKWKIRVHNAKFKTCVNVSLDLCGETGAVWVCETKNVLTLSHNDNGPDWTSTKFSLFHSSRECDETFFKRSILESGGYLKDDSIIVEIELDFKYYDFFNNIPNHTDLLLHAGGVKFHVNKKILCSESKYFQNLFSNGNNNVKELTIKDVSSKNFLCFLASTCLFFETIIEENNEKLIELAAEYKAPRLHSNCEKYLIMKFVFDLEKMIEYADKHDLNETMKTYIKSLTTTDQIEKLMQLTEFKYLKNTTKRKIEQKMLELVSQSQKNQKTMIQKYEAEKQLKCQNCSTRDLEEDFNICQTCNELYLTHFENEENLWKFAICSACAIKKHVRQGHVIIGFFSLLFENEMKTVQVTLENFEHIKSVRIGEEQTWKTLNDIAEMKIEELIELTLQSNSTKNLQQNMDEFNSFIETTKKQNDRYAEILRTQTLVIKENLQRMEKWMKEKRQ